MGAISSRDQWKRTLEAARASEPDALLIGGDLVDDRTPRGEAQVALVRELFPDLPVYAVTGNRKFYAGTGALLELCRKHSFRLLRQEVEPLSPGVLLAGIDDPHFADPGASVREVLARVPQGKALVLLSHRPGAARHLSGRPGTLVVSGHTHGGQIPPMFFLAALGNEGFHSGHYEVGRAHLYVSTGAGVWGPPMRLLTAPELVLVEIRGGDGFGVRVERGARKGCIRRPDAAQ